MSIQDPGKRQVIAAGKLLASGSTNQLERETAIEIVTNWRTRHIVPMGILATDLRKKCSTIDSAAFTAQRLKRMQSIIAKLTRRERDLRQMNLWTMQDIGGCRAILPTVQSIKAVDALYGRDYLAPHRRKNYIDEPKASGYRGIHLIFKYRGIDSTEYDGMQIEIQLRSRQQHIWATAVETVGYFTKQSLKSSVGPKPWLRFFSLMGGLIALRENCCPVPNTPNNLPQLISELRPYALEAREHLAAYAQTVQRGNVFREHVESDYYLLTLSEANRIWRITGYSRERLEEANRDYAAAESEGFSNAVLVATESLSSLWEAYPNYFFDLNAFTHLVDEVVFGSRSGVVSL